MIGWLGKRAPEEISYMLERWEPSMLVALIIEKISEKRREMLEKKGIAAGESGERETQEPW
jgi:hypothetical protein